MTYPPSSAEEPMGQDSNPPVDPLSGAVEYPPIEYHPTPPPGYSLPPNYGPPPLPPNYGPAFPGPGAFPPPAGYPPPGAYPPPAGYPPPGPFPPPAGYGPPPSAYAYGAPYVDPNATNGKAIGALVTAIAGVPLCCCVVPSIVAIVLGVLAMNETKRTGQKGHGMALAAVIVGGVTLVLTVLLWATGTISNVSRYR